MKCKNCGAEMALETTRDIARNSAEGKLFVSGKITRDWRCKACGQRCKR